MTLRRRDRDGVRIGARAAKAAVAAAMLIVLAGMWARCVLAQETDARGLPELSREARPTELIAVLGQRSAVLGHESGRFEAWAYPLKILHDFHLSVKVGGEVLEGDSLVRSITVRPESTTLVYAGDSFSIRETLTVPIDAPAALIRLEIDTAQPLETIAEFQPDLQLEWPGGIGGMDTDWNPRLHAYVMTEVQQRFEAVVGSPSATEYAEQYPYDYAGPRETAFSLGVSPKGHDTKTIVITGALGHPQEAEQRFQQLETGFDATAESGRHFYASYLKDRVQVSVPDPVLENAYRWSEISMIQALVKNPYLGNGLVAGFNTSGDDERPGFAWFFGRDALWTSLALDDVGDVSTARDALAFLARYQRADGKIPHEIAQSATFSSWFQAVPFAWAAADATPLFVIAMRDYVEHSGDVQFAQDHWGELWKAYQFLQSTYGSDGLAQNLGVGHGWVEAGPLVPIRAELYQSGLGVEATASLAALAGFLHKDDVKQQLEAVVVKEKPILNQTYWLPDQQVYSVGVSIEGRPSRTASVLATAPMWFGLLDADKVQTTIDRLAAPDFATDWGMRIISSDDPKYDPAGYHAGSVWPLFTGWTAVGEYRYHRALEGYANLRANAELTWAGSLGHVVEVLSGNFFQRLSTGSPDQVWSAAMVAAPLLRGLFGLEANALTHTLTFAPHVPADWTSFSIGNVRVGASTLDLRWSKTAKTLRLQITRQGDDACDVEYAPAVSLHAKVRRALLDGKPMAFHVEANANDQHVKVRVPTTNVTETVTIELSGDFGVNEVTSLPPAGSASQGVRVTSEQWSPERDVLKLELAGPAGARGELKAWDIGEVVSVTGGKLTAEDTNKGRIDYELPQANATETAHLEIAIHLRSASSRGR